MVWLRNWFADYVGSIDRLLLAVLLVLLFGVVGYQIVLAAQGHGFTTLETVAFTAGQVILSVFLSGLYSKIGIARDQQRFAKASVRRVQGYKLSLARLQHAIQVRRERVTRKEQGILDPLVLDEILDHFESLVRELDLQASLSVEDWADSVGQDLAAAKLLIELESEKNQALQQVNNLESEMAEVRAKLTAKGAEHEALISSYESKLRLAQQRAQAVGQAVTELERVTSRTVDDSLRHVLSDTSPGERMLLESLSANGPTSFDALSSQAPVSGRKNLVRMINSLLNKGLIVALGDGTFIISPLVNATIKKSTAIS